MESQLMFAAMATVTFGVAIMLAFVVGKKAGLTDISIRDEQP